MTDTPYKLQAQKTGEEKFTATLVKDGEVIESFEAKSLDAAVKDARAYAASHKASNTPSPLHEYKHEFHI